MNPTDTEMMDWLSKYWDNNNSRTWGNFHLLNDRPLRLAVSAAMMTEREDGSYSSADRNGPKASGPSMDPIPAAAGAAPGGVEEEDPFDGGCPADKQVDPTES